MDITDDFIKYLSSRINEKQIIINQTWRLTTPLVNYHDDAIELYIVKQDDGKYKITDDSETLDSLSFSGLDVLGSPSRKEKFYEIISTFQLNFSNKELSIIVPGSQISQGVFYISQAITKITALSLLHKQIIKNIFLEDVKNFFRAKDIGFESNRKVTGKSGMLAEFGIFLPGQKGSSPILMNAANKLRPSDAKELIFEWEDTALNRPAQAKYLVIYNDEFPVQKSTLEAIKEYGIQPLSYSKLKTSYKELLN